MPFDSRARHNSCTAWYGKFRMIGSAQIHNATIMYDGFIEQHLVLDIIYPAILPISAQMFVFRVATFVGPSAITNLPLAARLGWMGLKRVQSLISPNFLYPLASGQLGVCAACLYRPLLPGQKCHELSSVFVVLIKHTAESLVLC